MARLRSAPSAQEPASTQQSTRQALKEKTNTTRTKAPVYENDGDTEGLVKDARTRRGVKRKAAQKEIEFVMAGGLGLGDSSDKAEAPTITEELVKSDAPPPPTAKASRRPPRTMRKAVQNESRSTVLQDVKMRMQATARREATSTAPRKRVTAEESISSSGSLPSKPPAADRSINSAAPPERSDFSLSPSPPPPGKLTSVNKQRSSLGQPGSALRSQGTPAMESSILALKNFKRRPRQPSMLQMVQQRTASARPSAVNTLVNDEQDVYDLEDGDGDEDEFAPEAEGTPLRASKGAKQLSRQPKKAMDQRQKEASEASVRQSVSISKKRKSDEVDHPSSVLDALKSKRQRSTALDLQEPVKGNQEHQVARRMQSEPLSSPPPQHDEDVQVIHSSPSATPSREPSPAQSRRSLDPDIEVPSTEREQQDVQPQPANEYEHDIPNNTVADPASSSPLPPDPLATTQRTDILADPVTQISPPRPQTRNPKKQESKPVTTATLQSLLPKRRRRPLEPEKRRSEYDIDSQSEDDGESPLDSSHLDEDEDELSGRLRRQTIVAKSKGKKGGTSAKAKPKKSKPPPNKSRKSAAPPKKTYARRKPATTSDKENNEDGFEELEDGDVSALPDTSLAMDDPSVVRSNEMEAARRKFAEVDGWGLEFESMSFEEHRSSSQGWR